MHTGPQPDFILVVSPVSASAAVGTVTSAVTITIDGENGFTGPVSITIGGIPQGIVPSPSSSFSLDSGGSQALTFAVLGSAPAGTFPITVSASSGTLAHSAQLLLTAEPAVTVHTYQNGSVLYLESDTASTTSRLGLDTQWGGSIVEVSLNGTNFVNWHDTGREVQVAEYDGNAHYDGCAGCTGVFGWNPVQGGDKYDRGSPVLSQTLSADSLYIKAQPYQWNPDDKGGGPDQPVLGDVYVEATVSALTEHAFTFKVHYKITHFGSDQHADSIQEFPAVYTNLGYDQFARYSGQAPWTNDAVAYFTMPQLPAGSPTLYASEQWAAFADSGGNGLTVFVPGMAPYVGGFAAAGDNGPTGIGTNYFAPRTFFSFGPGSVLEGDVYLVAGDYQHARQVVYDLHDSLPATDIFAPFGSVDSPQPEAQLSGLTGVAGWALDNVAVANVEVDVDGVAAGTATYGTSRPDVAADWPNAPPDIGYTFTLDTRQYANGPHMIVVKAFDPSGNVAVFPQVPVTIQN
ncbi:MAG TPA: Ig-like domain-containing protein [Terriglobia bacterium]|nr:Ig-like domain-containing protein [Terriglobia bacterium]